MFLVAVAACGRIGFDPPSGNDGPLPPDAFVPPDAFFSQCPVGTTAPDPLTLSGTIVQLITASAIPGVALSASNTLGGSPIATATTDGTGGYSLDIPTGGVPIAIYLTLSKPGFLTVTSIPNRLLDASAPANIQAGTQADLDASYAAKSMTESPTAGSLDIVLSDCAFNRIAGATIQTTPPTTIVYSDVNGNGDGSLTSTTSSATALALNVPLGSVVVSATAPGMTFTDQRFEIQQNPIVTAGEMSPTP